MISNLLFHSSLAKTSCTAFLDLYGARTFMVLVDSTGYFLNSCW